MGTESGVHGLVRWVQGCDHPRGTQHGPQGTPHRLQPPGPQTTPQPRPLPSPFQEKLGGCVSPAWPFIKTPGMSRPSLIPIKSIQGINYQISG